MNTKGINILIIVRDIIGMVHVSYSPWRTTVSNLITLFAKHLSRRESNLFKKKIFCRFSRNFKDSNGTEFRTLYKAYGVKFVISVSGQARKFAPVPFFTVVGSGLALLSIVSLWYLSFGIICCGIIIVLRESVFADSVGYIFTHDVTSLKIFHKVISCLSMQQTSFPWNYVRMNEQSFNNPRTFMALMHRNDSTVFGSNLCTNYAY